MSFLTLVWTNRTLSRISSAMAVQTKGSDFPRILAAFPADVLVPDPTMLGAALLRQLGGPAYAALGVSVLAVRSRDTAPFGFALSPSSSR
jgi:hypothetical protein